jgi:HlyD family secretion protein
MWHAVEPQLFLGLTMTKVQFLIVGVLVLAVGCTRHHGKPSENEPTEHVEKIQVKFINPRKGALERLCVQPGSVQTFESIDLFAEVPGYLKVQTVDIGDHVKKGKELAIVDVPDIEAQKERNIAMVSKAQAQLQQMKSHVDVAAANLDAAEAAVEQADANQRAATAWVKYRKIQLGRMEYLVKNNSIEDRLYDESKERHDASVESEIAARAAIKTTKANVVASKAKIKQAEADVIAADAEIKVAEAEVKKAEVRLKFATIKAPFDGVITFRGMNPKDFVRAADSGTNIKPLLSIDRTDLFRVVVLVPDRDVKYIRKGKAATIAIDSLPGTTFPATVSRIAQKLDPQTRLMRVELDLQNNDKGEIYDGMYGQVTIVLEKGTELLSIPTSCVVNKGENGKASVFVIRGDKAVKVPVQLGMDSGLRVAVEGGLTKDEKVILNPSSELSEQPEVIATPWDDAKAR